MPQQPTTNVPESEVRKYPVVKRPLILGIGGHETLELVEVTHNCVRYRIKEDGRGGTMFPDRWVVLGKAQENTQ